MTNSTTTYSPKRMIMCNCGHPMKVSGCRVCDAPATMAAAGRPRRAAA